MSIGNEKMPVRREDLPLRERELLTRIDFLKAQVSRLKDPSVKDRREGHLLDQVDALKSKNAKLVKANRNLQVAIGERNRELRSRSDDSIRVEQLQSVVTHERRVALDRSRNAAEIWEALEPEDREAFVRMVSRAKERMKRS